MIKKRKKYKLSGDSVLAIIGSILIVGGILLGLYVGVWLLFVGGFLQMAQAVTSTPFMPVPFTIGLLKVLLCESAVFITIIISGIGAFLIEL